MNDLVALRERTRDVEATLPPAARRRLAVGRVLDRAMGLGLPVAVPLAMMVAMQQAGPAPEAFKTMVVGGAFGFGLAVLRTPLMVRVYRAVLREAGDGLHAVGGSTSVALPSFGVPKAPPSPAPPRFVEPVRPPPRVGDPDADDFDD